MIGYIICLKKIFSKQIDSKLLPCWHQTRSELMTNPVPYIPAISSCFANKTGVLNNKLATKASKSLIGFVFSRFLLSACHQALHIFAKLFSYYVSSFCCISATNLLTLNTKICITFGAFFLYKIWSKLLTKFVFNGLS